MPGSKRTFAYTIVPEADDAPTTLAQVERILGWACDGDERITCHGVTGEALGVVTMNLTIQGRDKWWAAQLAQDILNIVLWGLKNKATRLELESHRQAPHTHRGYAHGRTKRYRERNGSRAANKPDPQETSSSSSSSE